MATGNFPQYWHLPSLSALRDFDEALDYGQRAMMEVEDQCRRGNIDSFRRDQLLFQLERWMQEAVRYCSTSMKVAPRIGTPGPMNIKITGLSPSWKSALWDLPKLPPKPKPLPIETTWGEIIAFRVWRVRPDDAMLISSYTDHVWKPGDTMQAHAPVADFDDPHGREKTGVHGWKSVFEVVGYSQHLLTPEYSIKRDRYENGNTIVIGRVKLWGDVVEHQRGYRAEFAKIVSLDDCQTPGDAGPQYRETYERDPRGELLARLQASYFPRPEAKPHG